jgi:hypothetical protein
MRLRSLWERVNLPAKRHGIASTADTPLDPNQGIFVSCQAMIAFIQPPEESSRSPGVRHVHRLLAETLLSDVDRSDSAPPIAAWKAWLLAGWLAIAALWGVAHAIRTLL